MPNLTPEQLASWLAAVPCTLQARVTQYDPSRYNLLTQETTWDLAAPRAAPAFVLGSRWTAAVSATWLAVATGRAHGESAPPAGGGGAAVEIGASAADTAEALDLRVTFRCTAGALPAAAVAVDVVFPDWSEQNYVLLPAAAYNGNRFLARRIPYSPKLYYVQDIGPDKPTIITDVPKLNEAAGPSRLQDRSGSLATPAIGFHAPASKRGAWILTGQGNALGDYGIDVEESRDRRRAVVSIRSPLVREQYSYRICDAHAPSEDTPRDFRAGDEVTIALRLHRFAAPDRQALYDRFAAIRKTFISAGRQPANTLPFSACFAVQEEKFNRENFVADHGYYSVGPRQNFLQDWQIGWTGGMISTYPLLFAGSEATRANVVRNFDWLFPNGISPSGFFWDACANGTQWIGGDIRKPHTGNWHLVRKSGDAVYFIVKQLRLMEQLGIAVKPAWRDGTRHVCDAFVRLWQRHGQLGQFVDSLTGEVRVGGSTSGAIVPAALALAAGYFGDSQYLDVAVAAGDWLYGHGTRPGITTGGPGDACQNPDSESSYALVEAYVALFAATGESRWLTRAGEAARQFATWVVSYDFAFPPDSMFGRAGIRTTGAVYANTQNKHAAPGICTFSGLALLKLFRATGDRFPLELLHDIAHNLPQYLPHPLKPLGDAVPGRMCERVNTTDWEGVERIGETLRMTTWAETSLMLTAVEIPGLYVQPDRGVVVAFDNVEATIESDSAAELRVRVKNPTPAEAVLRVLAETAADAARPLADNALFGGRTETFEPGQSRVLVFAK